MRRALAMLRYVPAGLCGLLVAVWIASCFVGIAFGQSGAKGLMVEFSDGDVWIYPGITTHIIGNRNLGLFDPPGNSCVGRFQYPTWSIIGCPTPILLTLLLPLAIGALTRFRFPLWSWFAFTALVAMELAFYLR